MHVSMLDDRPIGSMKPSSYPNSVSVGVLSSDAGAHPF